MVGGLPAGTTEAEIEREFTRFGTLSSVWVARKPAGFGEFTCAFMHCQVYVLHPATLRQQAVPAENVAVFSGTRH